MKINIHKNKILATYTYFKLGGPADYFVEVTSKEELLEAINFAKEKGISYFILGSGSNILVTDKGYRGLVIKNKIMGIELDPKTNIIKSGSGVPVNQLIAYSISQSLAGLEDFLGLPGTVGGAIYNNSHHLDDLIGNHVDSVELITKDGNLITVSGNELDFAYDYSRLQKTGEIVVSASFIFHPGDKEELSQRSQFAVKRRSTTQPLGLPSSGCIFQNISAADAARIGTPNNTLSAGYLIDHAGLKGYRIGGASVSNVHANFIVSDQSATTQDVLDLIAFLKAKIKEVYNVELEEEVFLIGEK